MVRLKDIAARAGVSVMTVSKVLRDAPDISAATKARIRLLAEEMGYTPDSLAQGLRTKTTRLLGLVIPSVANPALAHTALAIEERAHELGYDLLLAHSHNKEQQEQVCIRRLLSRRVDGLFISPVYRLSPTASVYEELRKCGTPVVLIGHSAAFCADFPSVAPEDLMGSYLATRHLLELGHRRIAFLAGPSVAPWASRRLEGYRRALREASIDVDDRLIFPTGTSIEDGERTAAQLLQEAQDVTAVQASSDPVAIGAARMFLDRNLRIPADISIVGFGDLLLSEHFRVPLTTVRQPKYGLGLAAMDAMMRLIGGERPNSKLLPVQLVQRASTAPPKT